MFKEFDESLSFETNILEAGAYFRLPTSNPEAFQYIYLLHIMLKI